MAAVTILRSWIKASRAKLIPFRPKPTMSLITRLTIPLEGEEKIPAHQFMAACAEFARGVSGVDKTFIADQFNIVDVGELAELDDILAALVNRSSDRQVIHDSLLLGEAGSYAANKVDNRIAQNTGDADLEAITFRQVYRIQNAAGRGEFAFRGCNVNAQTTPDLTVEVTEGSILSNGTQTNDVAAVAALAIPTPDPDLPRVDLIYVDSSGTVLVRTGTPDLDPKAPAIGMVNECALAFVFVRAGATEIKGANIQDVTVRRNHGPLRIGSRNNPLTVENQDTIQQLYGQDIPGQLLTNRRARLVATGYIESPQQMSVEFRVRYGGVVLYRDTVPNLAASANRCPWRLEVELFGEDDAVQTLGGYFAMSDQSTPNVGSGAINNDEIKSWSPIRGESTVDSTVTENLNIAATMNLAAAGQILRIDTAYVELI